jgi:hypothetical protein
MAITIPPSNDDNEPKAQAVPVTYVHCIACKTRIRENDAEYDHDDPFCEPCYWGPDDHDPGIRKLRPAPQWQ